MLRSDKLVHSGLGRRSGCEATRHYKIRMNATHLSGILRIHPERIHRERKPDLLQAVKRKNRSKGSFIKHLDLWKEKNQPAPPPEPPDPPPPPPDAPPPTPAAELIVVVAAVISEDNDSPNPEGEKSAGAPL
jgi:hypothetical protein